MAVSLACQTPLKRYFNEIADFPETKRFDLKLINLS